MMSPKKTILQALLPLLLLVSTGCGNGGGSNISRKEFVTLQERVGQLEAAMRNELLVPGVYYDVVRIVDGDTFLISGNRKVRLHGIDTPESVHSQKGLQWYGKESSACLKTLLTGKMVRLQPEEGKSFKTGAYGRILAFVYRKDGMFVNAEVIRRGAALSYRKYKCSLREKFNALEAKAKRKGVGVWNDKARLAWEATHILPEVPAENAACIASKSSKIVHVTTCGIAPAPENGIYFVNREQANKFHFTRLHSCVTDKEKEKKMDSTDGNQMEKKGE